MILKKLELKNFRIHKETQLEFSEKINYIIGANGQGKTSILEAIYYLCTTKNFGSGLDSETVNFNESFFEIVGSFSGLTENTVRIFFSLQDNKKNIYVNGKQVFRAIDLIGKYPVVILTRLIMESHRARPQKGEDLLIPLSHRQVKRI